MKLLVDMNLSPKWVETLNASHHEAIHWSTVGAAKLPAAIGHTILTALRRFQTELERGAIVTVDLTKPRVRILPLN